MAGREIKTTLMVDGEQAFKRSLNEAKTSIRNLGTQLTLAQAEFKRDGDAMKLMETRSKALKGEISAQREIVKALEGAVKDAAKKYGEGSTEAEKWQAELNRAKAAMASLESELNNNEKGLDRNGKAFDSAGEKAGEFSQSVNDINRNVSFDTITSGIDKITGGFESAMEKVAQLGVKLWNLMRDAAAWADDEVTLAKMYGLTPEELQQMQYASKLVDTDVDTIIGAKDKLTKSIKSADEGSKDMVEAFQELRVPIKDANQQMRDVEDIFWDAGQAIMNMSDPVERNNAAMKIFGKSWRELLPLFDAGREKYESAKMEAPLVSDESIDKLSSFQDQLDKMDSEMQALKLNILGELAPAFETLAKCLTDMMKEFNEFLQTDEGKQMMADLAAAIENFFSGLKDLDFQKAVDTVKGILDGIKSSLEWIKDNKDSVKNALGVIAGGFALLKLGGVALTVGKTVSGFKSLVSNWLSGKAGGGINAGLEAGSAEAGGAVNASAEAAESTAQAAAQMADSADDVAEAAGQVADSADDVTEAVTQVADTTDDAAQAVTQVADSADDVAEAVTQGAVNADDAAQAVTQAGSGKFDQLWQGVKNTINQKALDASAWGNVFNITNSAAVGDWWTHNTKSGRWASNKITELLGGTAQFADEGGLWDWVNDWARERVLDNERRASGEANVLWDVFNADAQKKRREWEDRNEEVNYWREMHPFNEEQATVVPEGVKPWNEMNFAERQAWKASHPGVSANDMTTFYLRGHTSWNQAGGVTDTVSPAVYSSTGTGAGAKASITSSDINEFRRVPSEMEKSVSRALSQVDVKMDRESVGRLVAPVVSRIIAQDAQ